MKKFYQLLRLTFLLVFLSCSHNIDQSMLPGKYKANHKFGVDILEIKPDGTYDYYFKSNDGIELRNSNKWSFEVEGNKHRITFKKFIFGIPGYGSAEPGYWDVEVVKSGKTIRLWIDTDLNYYYEKP